MIVLAIEDMKAQKQRIEISVTNKPTQDINIKQDVVVVPVYKDVTLYEGDYEVTPKVVGQTLPTAEKLLLDDVAIKAIPFYNVGNNSGGSTVYIGNEV